MMRYLFQIKYYLLLLFLIIPVEMLSQIVVPVINQTELIPKILSMDKNINENSRPVVIGILYSSKSKVSAETADIIKSNLEMKGIKIKNLTTFYVYLDINKFSGKALEDAIISSEISVLYIAPTRGIDLNSINNLCKKNKILTISSEPSNAEKYFTVGFDLVNNNIKIIINHKSMQAENVDFSAYLLKVAGVINE